MDQAKARILSDQLHQLANQLESHTQALKPGAAPFNWQVIAQILAVIIQLIQQLNPPTPASPPAPTPAPGA